MYKNIVRFKSLELVNFKNILRSTIVLKDDKQTAGINRNVIGIYGQNGSGKTSVIDAFKLYKMIVSNNKQYVNFSHYINNNENNVELKFDIDISNNDYLYNIIYQFKLAKVDDKCIIESETIKIKEISTNDFVQIDTNYFKLPAGSLRIKYNGKEYFQQTLHQKYLIEFITSAAHKTSILFNERFIDYLEKDFKDDIFEVLKFLNFHAENLMYIFDIKESSNIAAQDNLTVRYNLDYNHYLDAGEWNINLFGTNDIHMNDLEKATRVIEQSNIVMSKLINNFHIDMKTFNRRLLEDAEEGISFELVSKFEDGSSIPLRHESEGIKKIISICSSLIAMFNNPDVFVAIDELDSGIFEYLLGELVAALDQKGKGQLIFTSHNLRLLEVLDKKSIIFSTLNPNKRFILMRNVKTNNNLRDFYLRTVINGGQKEELYNGTNRFELQQAMKHAGDILNK